MPNARRQLLPKAGAERTLEAVSCMPLFGMGKGLDSAPGVSLPRADLGHTDAAPDVPSRLITLPSRLPAG
jgi:hypothetical protein